MTSVVHAIGYVPSSPAPYYTAIIFAIVPVSLFLLSLLVYSVLSPKPHGICRSLNENALWIVFHLSPVIALLCISWAIVISCVQGVYLYHNAELATDLTYYLKVDLEQYQTVDLINLAESSYSFNYYYYQLPPSGFMGQRRLSASGSPTLGLIYHKSNWENMLSEENMISACKTEKNIRANIDCIDFSSSSSLLASVFNMETDCHFRRSYADALHTFSLSANSEYVADNVDPNNPRSSIIGSVFHLGSCSKNSDKMDSLLSAQSANDVKVAFLSTPYINSSFQDAIMNGIIVSIVALVVCSVFILFSVRGVIITLTTLFCIVVSVINAATVLSDFGYESFSAFNVLSIFILIGVGGNSVIMWGSGEYLLIHLLLFFCFSARLYSSHLLPCFVLFSMERCCSVRNFTEKGRCYFSLFNSWSSYFLYGLCCNAFFIFKINIPCCGNQSTRSIYGSLCYNVLFLFSLYYYSHVDFYKLVSFTKKIL
jgi:hypothetical protein